MARKSVKQWTVNEEKFPFDGSPEQKWKFLLQYAVLAPSHRNMQPWHFEMSEDRLELYADWQKGVQGIDPQGRELMMSCGAALFHLRVAMAHFSCPARVDAFPRLGDKDLVARVSLSGGKDVVENYNTLFYSIPHRHTNRNMFEDRRIDEAVIQKFRDDAKEEGASLHLVSSDLRRHELAQLIAEGDRLQGASGTFRRDLGRVIRSDISGGDEGIPARLLGYNRLQSLLMPFLTDMAVIGEEQAQQDLTTAEYSPYIAVLCTGEDGHEAWLAAGQALDRILLDATSLGISASFFAQPIEVRELRPKLRKFVGTGEHPQLILRMGYSGYSETEAQPTPRRPVRALRRRKP